MRILADHSLPLLHQFMPAFKLTLYDGEASLKKHIAHHDILLCRSTLTVNAALLANSSIQCIATASSGNNHIDEAYMQQHGITCFDAKGSNAHAVADYVLATLAWLIEHDLFNGMCVGVIGVGEVGGRVSERLRQRGFKVVTYDPLKALTTAKFRSSSWDDMQACDALMVHANYHANEPFPSVNLLDAAFIDGLKPGCVIINASRGGIVNEAALLASKHIIYCTDVFANEPAINRDVVDYATLCTPHIAGHSIEAKQAAINQLVLALHRHYRRPLPALWRCLSPNKDKIPCDASWVRWVLKRYNPQDETLLLKHSTDLRRDFVSIRKNHVNRHDF